MFDAAKLHVQVAVVTGLIACLDMQINEVIGLQRVNGCLCLCSEVCVPKACCAGHIDDVQACIASDASDKVNGRNDGSFLDLRISLRQRCHLGAIAASPRPDAVGGVHASLLSLDVERMLCQQILTAKDEVGEQSGSLFCFGTFSFEYVFAPRLQGNIVRRRAMQMLVAALDDQQVPILNACIEVEALRAKLFLKEANQHVAFFRLKPSAGMVLQEIAFETNQVATKGKVVFSEFHTDACCLKRSSAFIDKVLVITEDAGVGNLATGMEAVGNGLE